MKSKIFIFISIAIAAFPLLTILIMSLPWLLMGFYFYIIPSPPKPEITYSEFPYKLVYEIDGERFEYEDILICEFDGFRAGENDFKKYRIWTSKTKSGNKRIILYTDDNIEIFYSSGLRGSSIAGACMGDNERYNFGVNPVFPNAWYTDKNTWYTDEFDDEKTRAYIISAEDLMRKYKIKLVSWEMAPPIKNKFIE